MKKIFVPIVLAAVVATFTFCKKQEPTPPPDPNDVMKKTIAGIKTYCTYPPMVEYKFTFEMSVTGDTMTYEAREKTDTSKVLMTGRWDVKNERLFLYKKEGWEFDKINGSEVLNACRLIKLKTGASVWELHAGNWQVNVNKDDE